MTHMPETDFEAAVAEALEAELGEGAVDRQAYIEGPRWYCDIVVRAGPFNVYLELESRWSEVRKGMGQAIGYAARDPFGLPAVVVPADHVVDEKLAPLRSGWSGALFEFDEEVGEFR